MKPSQLAIVLDDNPSNTFSPGQTINGKVVIDNDKPRDIINISLTIKGAANVYWTEKNGNSTDVHKDKEVYFYHKINFFENESWRAIKLHTGVFSYPFTFPLPANLPSNFTGEHGKVEYKIASKLKLFAIFKINPVVKLPLVINGLMDLNRDARFLEEFKCEKAKLIGLPFLKTGPVSYKIVLPRTGFVCGEWIDFAAEYINHSEYILTSVEVSLMQRSEFYASRKSKSSRKPICSKTLECNVESGGRMEWGKNVLQIPKVPPTGLGSGCKIIDVKYYLKFKMHMSGFLVGSIKKYIDITIGTIPLPNLGEQSQNSENIGNAGLNEAAASALPREPILTLSLNLPPPTYEEVMKLDLLAANPSQHK